MNAARNVKFLYRCWLETRKRIDRGESLWHSTAKCAAVGTWSWQYSSLSLPLCVPYLLPNAVRFIVNGKGNQAVSTDRRNIRPALLYGLFTSGWKGLFIGHAILIQLPRQFGGGHQQWPITACCDFAAPPFLLWHDDHTHMATIASSNKRLALYYCCMCVYIVLVGRRRTSSRPNSRLYLSTRCFRVMRTIQTWFFSEYNMIFFSSNP